MINFALTKRQQAFRDEIIQFAQSEINPGVEDRDANQIFDRAIWEKCGRMRLMSLCIPKSHGGRGLDVVSMTLALEALGYGSTDNGLNFTIAAHLLACIVPIWKFGSPRQKELWLKDLSSGRYIASNAITEASSGSDVFVMETTAEEALDVDNDVDDSTYIVSGTKTYCSNAPVADVIIVYAQTDETKGFFGGLTSFYVHRSEPDIMVSQKIDKLGLRTCQLGEVTFNNTRVSRTNIIGKVGSGGVIFNHSMEWERIGMSALLIGTMNRLLEDAIEFCKERFSGGKRIAQYQSVAHPIATLKTEVDAARLLVLRAAWALDQGESVAYLAASAKLMTSELYRSCATQMHQLYAGGAFRSGNEIERNVRDAMAATIYSGTSEILKNIISNKIGLR